MLAFAIFTVIILFLTTGPLFFFRKDRKRLAPKLPAPGFKTSLVKANNINLFTLRYGEGSGKPLMLFVHGYPESWYVWRHQLKEFANGDYEVVAFNTRGYGPSSIPKDLADVSMDVLIEDIKCLIEALGHKSCILAGRDWGAGMCWEFVRKYPSMVKRYIAMDCPPSWKLMQTIRTHEPQKKKSWYIEFFTLKGYPELMLACNDYKAIRDTFTGPAGIVNPKQKLTKEDIDQHKAPFSYAGSLTATVNYYRKWVIDNPPGRAIPPPIQGVPVLFIHSDNDFALTPEVFKNLQEWATDIKEVLITGGSHWSNIEQPEVVHRYMREFLASSGV